MAAMSRDREGRLLLRCNPLRGLRVAEGEEPNRVLLRHTEYGALLEVSAEIDYRFHVALAARA